jgi:hypothetical protein
MESFWYDDISVLFDKTKLNKYIPLKSYTRDEKLNSIVRISIYVSLIFLFLTGNTNYLFITIFSLILTLVVHSNSDTIVGKNIEKNVENYRNIKNDSDFKKYNIKPNKYMETCSLPTDENPFMNPLVTDKRTRKGACKTFNNKKLRKVVDDKFGKGLFKDINSVYDRENSQREFYTLPSTTIPNDQEAFGKWLYNTPKTCKEGNGNQCVGNNYERLDGNSYQFI